MKKTFSISVKLFLMLATVLFPAVSLQACQLREAAGNPGFEMQETMKKDLSQMSGTPLSDRAFGLSIRTEAVKFPRTKDFKVVLRVRNLGDETVDLKSLNYVSVYLSRWKYDELKRARMSDVFVASFSFKYLPVAGAAATTPAPDALLLEPDKAVEFVLDLQNREWDDIVSPGGLYDVRQTRNLPVGNYYLFTEISIPDERAEKEKRPLFISFVSNEIPLQVF